MSGRSIHTRAARADICLAWMYGVDVDRAMLAAAAAAAASAAATAVDSRR